MLFSVFERADRAGPPLFPQFQLNITSENTTVS